MIDLDREQLKQLIERTNDQGTRSILMIVMALVDELTEHRREFREHESAEVAFVTQLIGSPAEHQQQHAYIQGAIKAQAERAALRRAVIEKSLTALVWAGLVFMGSAIWAYITQGFPR